MREIFLSICILVLPGAALAQIDKTSWANLRGLQAGQSIQVVDSASKKHTGTFMSISETAISLRVATGEQSIQKQDVRTVKLNTNKRRARNTLVGGAVGGGIGAVTGAIIGAATHKGCASEEFCFDVIGEGGSAGLGSATGFLGGVAIGGIVGALVQSHTVIYQLK
jgi:hypothetical protein